MWLLYATVHVFLLALVNYIDEYLTTNNKLADNSDIHTKIGGLLIVSTIFSFVGAIIIFIFIKDVTVSREVLYLGLISAIPIVFMLASYFYALTLYPAYQVLPLFLLSSLWLLLIELIAGGTISTNGLIGIILLLVGAYILDAGTLKLKIPTKLLLIMIPASSMWSIALYTVRVATENSPAVKVSFWQLVGIAIIGIILFLVIKKYRNGFLFRIKHQGKNFLGFSLLNESLSQSSYVFGNLAVAAAPVATYIPAMSGLQSVFLLALFFILPVKKERMRITKLQIISILIIAFGVYMIEKSG